MTILLSAYWLTETLPTLTTNRKLRIAIPLKDGTCVGSGTPTPSQQIGNKKACNYLLLADKTPSIPDNLQPIARN